MASGYSYTGGPSQCWTYFQSFSKCYAQADIPAQCKYEAADYFECLHGTKEKLRQKAIKDELMRRLKADAQDAEKLASEKGIPIGAAIVEKLGGSKSEES